MFIRNVKIKIKNRKNGECNFEEKTTAAGVIHIFYTIPVYIYTIMVLSHTQELAYM
jgi:hypothetical protein